jgi:parallel beta-helix repeat protein
MKRYTLLAIAGILFSLFLASGALAATLCVEPGGAGGCYPTIQAAVNAAGAGDVIAVKPGTYFENVRIIGDKDGLTIMGAAVPVWRFRLPVAQPEDVVVDAYPLGGPASGPGFRIHNVDGVTIRSLTVRNADDDGGAFRPGNIYSNGDFTTIDNVHLLSSEDAGVKINGDDATVNDCFIAANDHRGIDIHGDRALVRGNVIWNNDTDGIRIRSDNATIVGNDIIQVEDGDGIDVDDGDNAVITDNYIHSCGDDGIEVEWGNNAYIARNTIRTVSDDGIYLREMTNSTVTKNDVKGCDDEGIDSYTCDWDGFVCLLVGNNTFTDNIVEFTDDEAFDITEQNPTVTGNTAMNIFDDDGYDIDCPHGCLGGTISNNYAAYATDDDEGFDLDVDNMTISGNVAEHNAEEGFDIDGDNNTISNNTARYNGTEGWEEGFDIAGDGNLIHNNLGEFNYGRGFYVRGANTVTGNTALNNYRTGIKLGNTHGGTLAVNSNIANDNHGEGIANDATTGWVVITNNTALGNRTDICNDGNIFTFLGNTFVTGGAATACDLD